jgi:four helix bundle protein
MRGIEKLVVGEVNLQALGALRPLLGAIRRRDRALSEQLVRAMTNVALFIARAEFPVEGTRRGHLFLALASACEAQAVLQIAIDSGYGMERRAKRARALLDEARNMLLVALRSSTLTVRRASRLAGRRARVVARAPSRDTKRS